MSAATQAGHSVGGRLVAPLASRRQYCCVNRLVGTMARWLSLLVYGHIIISLCNGYTWHHWRDGSEGRLSATLRRRRLVYMRQTATCYGAIAGYGAPGYYLRRRPMATLLPASPVAVTMMVRNEKATRNMVHRRVYHHQYGTVIVITVC